MKRDAQINTQSRRSQLSDVDAGVVRWMKTNSVAHPFQALANINENLIRNGGFVLLLIKTLCTIHNNQFVLESGDTANMGRSEWPLFFSVTFQFQGMNESGQQGQGDVEDRQSYQEDCRHQRCLREELGNYRANPKKYR